MTETNINALCSVEAVFDGVDIEVTVEFSAGGGTFEHDELTAESRAKANQHPISSITGLQSALDGKANSAHVHTISDVTGLQSALDGKSSVVEHNDLTGRDVLNVHPKESITGLTILDTPEFADTQITPLSVEATYTPTVWTYLVGLFTSVPKSVKEHIVKGWTVIENLKSRVTFLENNIIASYIFTQDILTTFTLTGFEILPNRPFKVIIKFPQVSDVDTTYNFYVRFNDISSSNYLTTNLLSSVFTSSAGQLYTYVEFNFTLSDGDLDGFAMIRTRRTGAIGSTFPMSNIFGCNIQSITSLSILLYTLPKIPAGSSITIYKV